MKTKRSTYPLFVFLLAASFFLAPSTGLCWQGKVVGVSDGDTITVMHDGKGERIRLYGLDCPESHQDFGSRAKQFTSNMVFGKTVDVKKMDTDRYGRTVGVVGVNGKTLNEELLKSGMAWFYTQYCRESFCQQWKQYEEAARKIKVGLWSIPNPTPPWDFRHGTKSTSKVEQTKETQGSTDYHGNVSSRVFHKPDCQSYNCKNCTAIFKSRDAAIAADYKPCGMCRP